MLGYKKMVRLLLITIIALFTVNENLAQGEKEPTWEMEDSDTASKKAGPPTYAEILPLLVKNTCTACHEIDKRKVGPPFKAIAKREYSTEEIVNLIYKPKPEHWPDYATPMPPMLQVPKENVQKIAEWINSLSKK